MMSAGTGYLSLPGSERQPLPQATVIGPTDPNERLEVTVRVRRRRPVPVAQIEAMAGQLPAERQYLTAREYDRQFGADPKDLEAVAAFALGHGLQVVEKSVSRRSVVLSGTVQAAEAAFGVTLEDYEYPQGTYRGRTGPVSIPAGLSGIVEGVFGLDNRPFAQAHFSRRAAAAATTFTPPALAKLYDFPAGLDGTGQTIGIIELGGGYRPADLRAYFQKLGITAPRVSSVSVDHARNHAVGTPDSADGEVALDIEVAGAVAPGASIVVYFTPNQSDQNFLDALTTAIHDTRHSPSVISISWGGAESASTQAFMQQFDSALQSAALLGITVCTAAGDDGAADSRADTWDGQPHVDFPSASPWALSCGGTSLTAAGNDDRLGDGLEPARRGPAEPLLRRDRRRHQPVLPGPRLPADCRTPRPRRVRRQARPGRPGRGRRRRPGHRLRHDKWTASSSRASAGRVPSPRSGRA